MAKPNEDTGDSVTIKLLADDNVKELRRRTITLTRLNDKIKVGRSSKIAAKGLVAASDNAWFDSPVMSRDHAELVADLDKKVVYLRDTESLHGTFVGDDALPPNELVEVLDGSSIRFGAEIMRNTECFSPTTVQVGITHYSRLDQSPPTRSNTFRLPEYDVDDDSSSEDGIQEPEPELPTLPKTPAAAKPAAVVDLTQSRPQVDMVDLTDGNSPDHEPEDLIDLTSPLRAESPDMEVDEDEHEYDPAEEDADADADVDADADAHEDEDARGAIRRALNAAADMLLDNDTDKRSAKDLSDVESVSSQDSDSSESLDLSEDEETDSTDSEASHNIVDDGICNNRSDDDEGSNSDSEKGDWEGEYSSDDDVLDPDDPDTAGWSPMEEPPVQPVITGPSGIYTLPVNMNHGDGMASQSMHQADNYRLNNPCAFGGPYNTPYYPMAESSPVYALAPRVRLPPLAGLDPRYGGPPMSMPRPSMHFTAGSVGTGFTGEALGARTGKQEFFAAREDNRLRAYAPNPGYGQWARLPGLPKPPMQREACSKRTTLDDIRPPVTEERTDTSEPAVAKEPTVVEESIAVEKCVDVDENDTTPDQLADEPMVDCYELDENDKSLGTKLHSAAVVDDESSDSEESVVADMKSPTQTTPAVIPKSFASNQTVAITPLLRTGDSFLSAPGPDSFGGLELPTYPGDDDDEPRSAHELYKLKRSAGMANRRTHVGISDIVDVSPAPVPEAEQQASQAEQQVFESEQPAPVAGKGKRKADEMAEDLTEAEQQWEAGESILLRHLRAANARMLHPDPSLNQDAHAAAVRCSLVNFWSAPLIKRSRNTERTTEVRAPKRPRLRKIAERLGYAALGGATVGAALVSTLIYTAPTFT